MQKISIEQGLRALQQFAAAEWRLALPVALAFLALPPLVLGLVVSPLMREVPATMEGMRQLGLAMPGWVMPAMLLGGLVTIIGAMALQALVLVPRISVGEAILIGLRRVPAWIGASLIVFGVLFAALIVIGLLIGMMRAGATLLVFVTFLGMVVGGLYMILVMPLIVDKAIGPIAALRQTFRVYRGQIVRELAGLALFLAGAWVLAMAIQVALGSVLLLLARLFGQPELGQTFVTLLGALVSAVEWGAFYLLVACFYRQRARD